MTLLLLMQEWPYPDEQDGLFVQLEVALDGVPPSPGATSPGQFSEEDKQKLGLRLIHFLPIAKNIHRLSKEPFVLKDTLALMPPLFK
jgi:hypothetical protein